MWQAEIRVDLGAIRTNVERLRHGTAAEVMAVVKADGYGHGMIESARAGLAGGASWLGVCTIDEALTLRRAGFTVPVLAWLIGPKQPLADAITADVDISVASLGLLDEVAAAARTSGRTARVHLKIDTGLSRNGATPDQWAELCEVAAKLEAAGELNVVGVWSHFVYADVIGHETTDHQLAAFGEAVELARVAGLRPAYRHLANSAATLTRPDTHFDLVRPGVAMYGLSPIPGRDFGLRPAMTAHARVILTKRVPAGQGVSYGHTYHTSAEATLALVPLGYGDGVPRAASNVGPVWLAGARRRVSGRVCMDQFVVDCGDDPVEVGDIAVLFGPGDDGLPTADDWAAAVGTINYEIVTRFGSARISRVHTGDTSG